MIHDVKHLLRQPPEPKYNLAAAVIMDGNDRFNYRVVVRDTDADETITVRFL